MSQKKYYTTNSIAKVIDLDYRKVKARVNGTGLDVLRENNTAVSVVGDLDTALDSLGIALTDAQRAELKEIEGISFADYDSELGKRKVAENMAKAWEECAKKAKSEISTLQLSKEELQRNKQALQDEVNRMQQITTELQRNYNSLEETATPLQQVTTELQQQLKESKRSATELQQSNDKLQQDYNELQQTVQPLQKKYNELQQTNKALKERNATLQEELQRAATDNNALEQQLQRAAINEQQGLEELQQVIQSNENELVELRRFKRNNARTDEGKLLANGWTVAGILAATFTVISLFRTLQVGNGGGGYNAFFAVAGSLMFATVMFNASRGALYYNGFKFKLSLAVLVVFYFAAFFIDAKCFAASLQVSDIQFNPYIPAFLVASVGIASVLMKRKKIQYDA